MSSTRKTSEGPSPAYNLLATAAEAVATAAEAVTTAAAEAVTTAAVEAVTTAAAEAAEVASAFGGAAVEAVEAVRAVTGAGRTVFGSGATIDNWVAIGARCEGAGHLMRLGVQADLPPSSATARDRGRRPQAARPPARRGSTRTRAPRDRPWRFPTASR